MVFFSNVPEIQSQTKSNINLERYKT